MRREDVELSISVYAECDDGTGRVFVSARRETARELLRCTVSDCAKLRALCKRAGGFQQYSRKDSSAGVCVCICMSVCLSLYSVCSSLSQPLSTSLDLSRPLSTSVPVLVGSSLAHLFLSRLPAPSTAL